MPLASIAHDRVVARQELGLGALLDLDLAGGLEGDGSHFLTWIMSFCPLGRGAVPGQPAIIRAASSARLDDRLRP